MGLQDEAARYLLPRPSAVESPRTTGRAAARSSTALSAAILLLVVGTTADGLCGETTVPTGPFAAASSETRSFLDRRTIGSDSPPAVECDLAGKRQRLLEREPERDSVAPLPHALTSSLGTELDALQGMTEAARTKHRQALDQTRERASALARELAALPGDTARSLGREAAQAIDHSIKQAEALEQARDKVHNLALELSFACEELEAAHIFVSKAFQIAHSDIQRDQALAIERDKADNLARSVAALRVELDKAQIAASEGGKAGPPAAEHAQALDRERDRADALARDLSTARAEATSNGATEVEQRQTLQKELQQQRDGAKALEGELVLLRAELARERVAAQEPARNIEAARLEQKQALEKERDRSDALARDLASVNGQLGAANRQLAALKAPWPLTPVDGFPEWVATSLSAVRERPPRSDEQRLLGLATILLRETEISSARRLLERAARGGSAQAAFMLAETYDSRLLQSRHAHNVWGNASKALELYKMAQSGGIEDARERVKRLQRASVRSSRAQVR